VGKPGAQQPIISSETSPASPLLERPAKRPTRVVLAFLSFAQGSLSCGPDGLGRGAGANRSELAHHVTAERLERITSSSSPGYFIFPEPVLGQPSALARRRPTELLGGLAAKACLAAL
jgi:hypothetical protein